MLMFTQAAGADQGNDHKPNLNSKSASVKRVPIIIDINDINVGCKRQVVDIDSEADVAENLSVYILIYIHQISLYILLNILIYP